MNTRWGRDTDPVVIATLSHSQNLFCWLLWPQRPGEIVTDYISLLFDLTPKIIYHGVRYVFPFTLCWIMSIFWMKQHKGFPGKRWWCLEWLVTLGIKTYNLERNYYLCDSSPIYLFFLLFWHYLRKNFINGGYFSDWQNHLFVNLSKV